MIVVRQLIPLVLAGRVSRALLFVSRAMEFRRVNFLVVSHGKVARVLSD